MIRELYHPEIRYASYIIWIDVRENPEDNPDFFDFEKIDTVIKNKINGL